MNQDTPLEAFCAFFNKLDKTCTENLYEVYTDDVVFVDPLHRIEGRAPLEAYFRALYQKVSSCRFDFHERVHQEEVAFVRWTMHLEHPRLDGGRPVTVAGCSHLTFARDGSGRVCRHRDYFDAGELLYEHLPLLGSVVRRVKRQFGN